MAYMGEDYCRIKANSKRNVEIWFLYFHKDMEDSIRKRKILKKLIL